MIALILALLIQVPVYEPPYEVIQAKVTASAPYDNQSGICADSDPLHTATMTTPRIGVIAVDPSKIAYGTQVYIDGYGTAVAEDTGGALRNYDGYAIDVFMQSYDDAMAWGVQYIDVIVYKD